MKLAVDVVDNINGAWSTVFKMDPDVDKRHLRRSSSDSESRDEEERKDPDRRYRRALCTKETSR